MIKISDVYEGDHLVIQKNDDNKNCSGISLNREEQARLCVFLAETRPQMILTAMAASVMKREKKNDTG